MKDTNYTGYQIGWWRSERDKRIQLREEARAFNAEQTKFLSKQMRTIKFYKLSGIILPIVVAILAAIVVMLYL
jgi:hypothetical protein